MSMKDFIAQVRTRGLARSNRYEVIIPIPPSTVAPATARLVALFCDSVNLPSYNIATTPASVYGETIEMPYNRTFEPVTMSFYCDNGLMMKGIFEAWLMEVIDPYKRTINYYNTYTRDIDIVVQTVDGKSVYTCKLFEAYPKSMQAVQLDASNKDIMKINVTFQFKYWDDEWNSQLVNSQSQGILIQGDPLAVITGTGVNDIPVVPSGVVTNGSVEDFSNITRFTINDTLRV